jgi:hypothetical protein
MSGDASRSVARRWFLSRFGATLAATGATLAAAGARVRAQSSGAAAWQPARHAKDDWLSQLPGSHRFVLDTTSPAGFESALQFANNYFTANKADYGLNDNDLAVVLIARHNSTPFAYNGAIWSKYRAEIVKAGTVADLPDLADRLNGLIKRGVHLAVCQMATRRIAGVIAKSTNGNQDKVFEELAANLVANAHLVAAGIVAVNRAQERGYSLANAG